MNATMVYLPTLGQRFKVHILSVLSSFFPYFLLSGDDTRKGKSEHHRKDNKQFLPETCNQKTV